uniref:Probable chitinase 3 n=1 Tax=Cacopsylla melanoneura TaxID=428564 RepID=A0A8D8TW15_9HEMI
MNSLFTIALSALMVIICCGETSCDETTTPRISLNTPTYRRAKICYFANWAFSRTGPSGNFTPEDIDFSSCDFICYAFAGLNKETYKIQVTDKSADLSDNGGQGLIAKVVSLANSSSAQGVLISLGGWGESNSTAYPTLFTNETLQDEFVQDSVQFLKKYGFIGLDLDYEYPQCPQGTCNPGTAEKEGFSKLIVKLRTEYKKHHFYLTAAVSANVGNIDKYYEPKVLNDNLDWIGLMTYDYHVQSEPNVGLTAPFFQYGSEPATLNVKSTVEAWISKGVAANKLVLGIPLYGVSYTLADKNKTTIGSPAAGPGKEKRALFYNEICPLKNQGWTEVSSENGKPIGGTYAYKDDQWVGYDSVTDVEAKGKYILDKDLQGYMVWELAEDDFRGLCGAGKYPLLKALAKSVTTQ